MFKNWQILGTVCACLLTACAASTDNGALSDPDSDVAQADEAVVGGSTVSTNYWNSVVYVRAKGSNGTVNWWGLGSGEIIGNLVNSAGTITHYYVATARHNTELSYAPWDPNQLAVTTALNPGSPLSLAGQLCSTCVKPIGITNTTGPDSIILKVPASSNFTTGLTTTTLAGRLSLYYGENSSHTNRTGYVYGYGMSDYNGNGLGTLRRGGGQRVETVSDTYIYINPDDNNVIEAGGDSGGPVARNFTYSDASNVSHSWQMLLGVTYENVAQVWYKIDAGPQLATALQNAKGYLYVASYYNPTGHMRRTSNSTGTTVYANSTSTDAAARWIYDYSAKTLRAASLNLCLTSYAGEGSNILGEPCSGANNQKWAHNKYQQLVNVATGACAAYHSNGGLKSKACVAYDAAAMAEQAWAFHGYDQ